MLLEDSGIRAGYTVTERCAVYRFVYPEGRKAWLRAKLRGEGRLTFENGVIRGEETVQEVPSCFAAALSAEPLDCVREGNALILSFPAPVLLALCLNEVRNSKAKKIMQTITYAPHFLSTVVVVGLVASLTNINYGLINILLKQAGIIEESINFMTKENWFRPLYIISSIWQETGWNAVVYMAALSSVDVSLYEAARVDGAGRLRSIWHVTLPCIAPTMITMLILNCGKVMNIGYEKVLLMQNDLNMAKSDVITTYVYQQGILKGQYSYSTAVNLFNSVINTMLVVTVNAISRRVSETSLW